MNTLDKAKSIAREHHGHDAIGQPFTALKDFTREFLGIERDVRVYYTRRDDLIEIIEVWVNMNGWTKVSSDQIHDDEFEEAILESMND